LYSLVSSTVLTKENDSEKSTQIKHLPYLGMRVLSAAQQSVAVAFVPKLALIDNSAGLLNNT